MNYISPTILTKEVVPPSNVAVPLSDVDLFVNWVDLQPLEDNTGTVLYGEGSLGCIKPLPFFLPAFDVKSGVRYNLKNIFIKTNGTDGVIYTATQVPLF